MKGELLKIFLNGRVVVGVGDITKEDVDAIVNAANGSLMGGGGVDGAIHRAGGREIKEQCAEIRRTRYPAGLPTGEAVLTSAGKMAARHVIHTVGPVYGRGGEDKAALLSACYRNSLSLAAQEVLKTVAFPAISTGIYGYPLEEAARVSSEAMEDFLVTDSVIREVRLVFFSLRDAQVFLRNETFKS
ncbi:MAG TPA: O-acetyl-ADP-ribose deacetylase [Candidatus Binatia bacterium]|jgi:O-acetyl-ADP-ribose deacetylase (regulator of RNase III)